MELVNGKDVMNGAMMVKMKHFVFLAQLGIQCLKTHVFHVQVQ